MPFKSKAQRKWMYANDPAMAKKWEKHTPKGTSLPEHVKKVAEIRTKLAAVLAQQTLVPGAPPVERIQPPAGQQAPAPAAPPVQPGQPPAPQPNATGTPTMPQAAVPQLPGAKDVAKQPMTTQSVGAARAAQPSAINNSEAIVANKLSKMGGAALSPLDQYAALVYGLKLATEFKKIRG